MFRLAAMPGVRGYIDIEIAEVTSCLVLDAANDEQLTVGQEAGLPPKVAWPWSRMVCSGVSWKFGLTQANRAVYSELR